MKLIIVVLLVAIVGIGLVALAEAVFGVEKVFVFASITVAVVGIVVVPIMQMNDRRRAG